MLLNDVVMGRVVKLTRTDTSLRQVRCHRSCEEISFPYTESPELQPPPGFDAVIGEPGGDLNYDECVSTCLNDLGSFNSAL